MKHVLSLALGLVLLQSCQKQQVIVNVENPKVTFQKQIQRELRDTIKDADNKPFPVPFKAQVSIKKGDEFIGYVNTVLVKKYKVGLSINIVSPIPTNGWYFTYQVYDEKGRLVAAPYNLPDGVTEVPNIKSIKLPNVATVLAYDFLENKEYTLKVRVKAYGSIVNIPESYFEFKIED